MAISGYKGEEIIANLVIKGGKKYEERVWMPRTVFMISGLAGRRI